MNALLGYSELMKRELTDPKLLDYQEKMEQSEICCCLLSIMCWTWPKLKVVRWNWMKIM